MEISMELEAVALLVTLLLYVFHVDEQQRENLRYRLFNLVLLLSSATIVLNLASAWGINHAEQMPLWANYALATAYFHIQFVSLSLMTGYGFYLLNEHVTDRRCFRKAVAIIAGLGVLLNILVIFNPWTQGFFWFENGIYMRGPINKLGFAVFGVELIMAAVCYFQNRQIVSRAIRRLMHALPPVTVLLLLVQVILPNVMTVGMTSALVNLIFFISFQSNRIGQDSLTELPNRHAFFQRLTTQLQKGERMHLVAIYLEHFEAVNSKYGTRTGDMLLYMVARWLDRFAPRYQVFRLGNTRFVLMGEAATEREADVCARKIQERFAEEWSVGEINCMLEVSMAHMIADSETQDETKVAEELEYALTTAREAQNGSLVFFDERLRTRFKRKLYVLSQVRRALDEESFEIYYQPIFSAQEGRFTTAESLLRLFDENGEMISPSEFIPLAEQNGLIDEISWLVLKKVCQFLAAHPNLPLQSVSINMSIQQLIDRSFFRRIHSCQTQYGIAPEKLCIEITERTITENPSLVRTVMTQLAAEGVRFYLDDFGIGYSNLAGMIELPFDTIKLDASLIRSIDEEDEDGKAAVTMRLLAQMLHEAGFNVVAEGVETINQVEQVKALGIDRIQGYYYAKPVPGDRLEAFLAPKRLVLVKNENATA